jgi:hypothetical protein
MDLADSARQYILYRALFAPAVAPSLRKIRHIEQITLSKADPRFSYPATTGNSYRPGYTHYWPSEKDISGLLLLQKDWLLDAIPSQDILSAVPAEEVKRFASSLVALRRFSDSYVQSERASQFSSRQMMCVVSVVGSQADSTLLRMRQYRDRRAQ